MMKTVQLSLTKEQAALLKPLLQELDVTAADYERSTTTSLLQSLRTAGHRTSTDQTDATSPDTRAYEPPLAEEDGETDVESMGGSSLYTIKDLLCKKKKDTKSTKAQNFLHVSNAEL